MNLNQDAKDLSYLVAGAVFGACQTFAHSGIFTEPTKVEIPYDENGKVKEPACIMTFASGIKLKVRVSIQEVPDG